MTSKDSWKLISKFIKIDPENIQSIKEILSTTIRGSLNNFYKEYWLKLVKYEDH